MVTPWLADHDFALHVGDVLDILPTLPAGSVHCCVTSPPYWGLRDYGTDGQLGLEATPEEYVARMVTVFREVRRVLRDDGTLWLNIGDSYASSPPGNKGTPDEAYASSGLAGAKAGSRYMTTLASSVGTKRNTVVGDLKPKDLVGIPWRLAFALQQDGWYLRADIIWSKPNPMPESVTDRPTKAHEYLFLLTKSARYFYDADAIREPYKYDGRAVTHVQGGDGSVQHRNGERWPGLKPRSSGNLERKPNPAAVLGQGDTKHGIPWTEGDAGRNKRSVWEVATEPYPDAHFATYPQALIQPCIQAGSPEGGTVLDPFLGSGTTALVARRHGRHSIGIELNPAYAELAARRLGQQSLLTQTEGAA